METNKLIKYYHYSAYFIIFLVALFEIFTLGIHRLQCDEALYSTWAMQVVSGTDIFLQKTTTLKFPLVSYIISLFFMIFGNNDKIARVPGIIVSIATLFFLYKMAVKIYNEKTGLLAVAIAALCKYYTAFGATAFTDPYLTFFLIFSLWLIAEKKYFTSGIILGVAVMAKLTGLFFLPFYLLAVFILGREGFMKHVMEFIKGFGIMFLSLVLWAWLVESNKFGVFTSNSPLNCSSILNMQSFKDGIKFLANIHLEAIGPGKPVITTLILPALLLLKKDEYKNKDFFIWLTIIAFYANLALMSARCMPIYDRYMLAIIPFIFIGTARAVMSAYETIKTPLLKYCIPSVLLAASLLPINPKINFGAYYGDMDGYRQAVDFLKPEKGDVIFSIEANGWEAGYYFYGVNEIYDVSFDGRAQVKEYIASNEGKKIFLLVRKDKANAALLEKEFEDIKGVYLDCAIKKVLEINPKETPVFLIYETVAKGKLKTAYIANSNIRMHGILKSGVKFDQGSVELLAADYKKEVPQKSKLTLYWHISGKPSRNWRIYVHFKNSEGKIIFGADHALAHGLVKFIDTAPSSTIIDIEKISNNRIKEADSFETGLYDEKTGKRAERNGGNIYFKIKDENKR